MLGRSGDEKYRQWTSQRMVIGNVIIDKPTNSVMISRKKYVFFGRPRVHVIPLQEVLNVSIELFESRPNPIGADIWTVYIRCKNSKRIKVSAGSNKAQQFGLASALSTFLNKEIKETKAGPSLLERIFSSAQEEQNHREPPSTSMLQ